MDWNMALNIGGPLAGILIGGLLTRRKTKADAHSVVVTDASKFGSMMLERAERAEARIDALEDRENRRDQLARKHLRWDWKQVRKLGDLGLEVEDPPPLFLYDDEAHPTPKEN